MGRYVDADRRIDVVFVNARQVQHQQEMLVAHVQEGFRAADFRHFNGHRQFQVIVVTRHQRDMAGAHAEAELALAHRAQIDVKREVHEIGEAHFVAGNATRHQVDRRLGEQLGRQHGLRLVVNLGRPAALNHPALMENGGGAARARASLGSVVA